MSDKPVTIIISDLHVGGGAADPGDDHVYQTNELVRFLQSIPEADKGQVELIINGDFLEFAQVLPTAFSPASPEFWCTQQESLTKLKAILDGHQDIFQALKEMQLKGNQVTIGAGNHDVDLYWADVQAKLKEAVHPDLKFETGANVYFRYHNRLVIGHGHMYDPANRFLHWQNPIDEKEQRLEMCPGTLFMVQFVNEMEKKYPFADNLKPVTALGRVLWADKDENDGKRKGFRAAAKLLFQFTYNDPLTALNIHGGGELKGIARTLLIELHTNSIFQKQVTELYQKVRASQASPQEVLKALKTEEQMTRFLKELVLKLTPEEWMSVLGEYEEALLGAEDETTLSILRSGLADDKRKLREEAITYLTLPVHEVVVFGHTHQPDEWRGLKGTWDGGYFNPGSWTRYVDLEKAPNLTLEDLKNEQDFPYQLNYIRVEQSQSGKLRADKCCFEEQSGNRFAPTPHPQSPC
jgi:UDP-2,3-diacylglucosamine pyrophosphatase LpxH